MSCRQAFFTSAHCRIDVEPREAVGATRYIATVSVVDPDTHEIRPLVSKDGSRLAFAADSEPLAFNSSFTYLEQRFGAFSEVAYECGKPEEPLVPGAPIVLDDE
jgi:hypothetical protein